MPTPAVVGTSGPMALGVAYQPAQQFAVIATASGTVTVQFKDGSSSTYPVTGGTPAIVNVFSFAVTRVLALTATGTCENWSLA